MELRFFLFILHSTARVLLQVVAMGIQFSCESLHGV